MSLFRQGRYSGYLRPISYIIDLIIINGVAALYLFKSNDPTVFFIIISISWFLLSVYSRFYEVYRYTRP
ncbi:MAG: undecaprenyl-phosphate glucose phosphotransferase, partial [Winogradskyella arenosi]